ncbi:MAG: nitroreductase family protein [Candidatus Omnitrophica bacterium]|nr:nitroreductase family protein [Candidatus Omnitrophota bacterium]MCM8829202.1 nitroreductase family protein [Candidatus Omnitrophota bacterium]
METMEAIRKRRTIRRFLQKPISFDILKELVDAARLAPSGGNLQPWEFLVIDDKNLLEPVFSTLAWAAYLGQEGKPKEGEKPVAYIAVLHNKKMKSFTPQADFGAAIENILLAAVDLGIGSCWIGSVQREKLAEILKIPADYSIEYVVALGYPAETAIAEDEKGDLKYWRDKDGIHHVPKRRLEEVLHHNRI